MNINQTLKQYFGYDSLRTGQEELINGILSGHDVLGIMPTGAGKSLCYQLPALMLKGITLVISPLISLMSDQVKALNQAGVHAAYINSSLTENQIRMALSYASQGRYKIIYVAPERLNTPRFLDFACNADISMLTVDEAHCISQWGQDFRPSYLEIAGFLTRLPRRPIVSAFTATATERVKNDIVASLGLNNPVTMVTSENSFCISEQKEHNIEFTIDIARLVPGRYTISPVMYEVDEFGTNVYLDGLKDIFCFEVITVPGFNQNMVWQSKYWGYFYGDKMRINFE